jgi:hypothetical protein
LRVAFLIVLLKNTILLLPFSACVTNFSPAESYFWRCRRSLTSLFGSYCSTSLPSNCNFIFFTFVVVYCSTTLAYFVFCCTSLYCHKSFIERHYIDGGGSTATAAEAAARRRQRRRQHGDGCGGGSAAAVAAAAAW